MNNYNLFRKTLECTESVELVNLKSQFLYCDLGFCCSFVKQLGFFIFYFLNIYFKDLKMCVFQINVYETHKYYIHFIHIYMSFSVFRIYLYLLLFIIDLTQSFLLFIYSNDRLRRTTPLAAMGLLYGIALCAATAMKHSKNARAPSHSMAVCTS